MNGCNIASAFSTGRSHLNISMNCTSGSLTIGIYSLVYVRFVGMLLS